MHKSRNQALDGRGRNLKHVLRSKWGSTSYLLLFYFLGPLRHNLHNNEMPFVFLRAGL